jgi:hypothetical protein
MQSVRMKHQVEQVNPYEVFHYGNLLFLSIPVPQKGPYLVCYKFNATNPLLQILALKQLRAQFDFELG